MGVNQISIFLENTTGRLYEATKIIAQAGINIRAINLGNTADFGILRLTTDKTDETIKVLNEAGFTAKLTEATALELDDEPGSIAKLLEKLRESNVGVEYLYTSYGGAVGRAIVILKLNDDEKGMKVFKDNNYTVVETF